MMRVLLDANILISYLLAPENSLMARVMEAGILGRYAILLPEDFLSELISRARAKPYLAERITPRDLHDFARILTEMCERILQITEEIPAVTWDPKDDCLLAYALVGQADYLVTGDRYLLVLGHVEPVQIITPRAFAEIIEAETPPQFCLP